MNSQRKYPPELEAELERQFIIVKKQLKPLSKNELIRTVAACLVDNWILTERIKELSAAESSSLPKLEIEEADRA